MLSRLFRFERKPFSVTQRIEESRTKATSSIENSKHDGRGPSWSLNLLIVFEVFGLRSSFSETGKLDLGTQKRPPLAYVTKKNQWILKYNQLFERQMKKTFGIPFSKQNQYTVKIQDLASNVKIRKVNKEAIFAPSEIARSLNVFNLPS